MLVVISITVLLVAMLMPALREARSASKRTICLSDRRQLNISSFTYGNDYKDLVPSDLDTPRWNVGDRRPSPTIAWNGVSANTAVERPVATTLVYPIGSLVYRGYIGSPNIIYCQDFPRNELWANVYPTTSIVRLWLDSPDPLCTAAWASYNSSPPTINGSGFMTTVSHYLYAQNGNSSSSIPNLRFSMIADNWALNTPLGQKMTAFQYSCTFFPGTTYYAGHDRGSFLPTAFIDGSGRVINMREMKRKYNSILTDSPYNTGFPASSSGSRLQWWARLKNDDTRPGGS